MLQVDIRTSNGSTALHSAAANGHISIVELLLQYSSTVNIRALTGATPLYMAASSGHLPAVVKLVEHEANLSIPTTTGATPLHIAATNGYLDVVQHLLTVCAAKEIRSEIDLQVRISQSDCSCMKRVVYEIEPVRIEAFYGFMFRDLSSWLNGYLPSMTRVLVLKLMVGFQAQNGSTALHQAALSGHVEIVKALLDAGCDTDVQNTNCCTALHLAASKGVEVLLISCPWLKKGKEVVVPVNASL